MQLEKDEFHKTSKESKSCQCFRGATMRLLDGGQELAKGRVEA